MLRNDLAELERLAGWLEGWARENVSPAVSFAVQLCLEEAVANVIMYGGTERLEIAVEVERNDGTIGGKDRGQWPAIRPHAGAGTVACELTRRRHHR